MLNKTVVKHILMKNLIIALSVMVLSGLAGALLLGNVIANDSPSIPIGYYLKTHLQPKVGRYAMFENPHPENAEYKYLLKKVAKIENGKAWVEGRDPEFYLEKYGLEGVDSYDSSYFGWVDIKESDMHRIYLVLDVEKIREERKKI